ncbi:MAG: TolC family protein [Rhizobiaceae bacterium]
MIFRYSGRSYARLIRLPLLGAVIALSLSTQTAWAKELTLGEILAHAVHSDPAIAANAARLDAANAGVLAADVRPRDTIGVDVEDFAGTGAYSPVDRSQTTAWYERTWERGGKREARIAAARSEAGVTAERNRLRLLDLLAQVQVVWVEAQAAEAAIPVAQQRLAAAERMKSEVDRRVARALDPLFAAERAKANVAQARIALDQAEEQARIARASLASWWGGNADYSIDTASFTVADTATGGEDIADLAMLTAEQDAAQARVLLAETSNVGDPAARVGLRHFGQGNDVALVVGGSIPLGNKSANRGNVEQANAERRAAEAEVAVARIALRREIERLIAERTVMAQEVVRIDREVLPSAERAVALARDGFARGGTAFTFLEINQASQAVTDTQSRRIDLLRQFHLAGARLDRLTGRHASLLANLENRP